MKIIVDKRTNKIKMRVSDKIKFNLDIFDLLDVPDEELEGYDCYYINGKIEKQKIELEPQSTLDREQLNKDMEKAKNVEELKEIIKNIINTIK